MSEILGNGLGTFIGITLILAGGAAFLTGQALARGWRPQWQAFVYGALLGCADRFIIFALFEGELLSLTGYLVDTAVIIAIVLLGKRITLAHNMVAQYPWLYEPDGLFGWREKRAED